MIAIPDEKQIQVIEGKSNDVVEKAAALIIKNQSDYDGCAEFLKSVKLLKKEIDQTFDDSIKKAHEAHKAIVAAKKKHYEPLDNAEKIIKRKSIEWYRQEQQKAQDEQRRKEEEARRAEEKRKAELERQAQNHEAKGNSEKAQERREAAEQVHVPTPIVENRVEKAVGQSIKTTWKAEITDIVALCRAIADGKLPPTMVDPNMKNLNALARTMQDKMAYPGVKFVAEQTMSVRA